MAMMWHDVVDEVCGGGVDVIQGGDGEEERRTAVMRRKTEVSRRWTERMVARI